jgi:hypothetical protein
MGVKQEEIKLFGGMNLDDDERLLGKDDYREAMNCRLYSSEGDSVGAIENIPGTDKVLSTMPTGTNKTMGWYADKNENAIYYLIYNSRGDHAIKRYNVSDGTIDAIVTDNAALNFQLEYPIDVKKVGDILFWTDGYDGGYDDINPPRMINVVRAYNYTNAVPGVKNYIEKYVDAGTGLHSVFFDRIKRPPNIAPSPIYSTDTNYQKNNLRGKLFQFCYRYTYDDNEQSTFSPFSWTQLPTGEMTVTGNNRLEVWFYVGGRTEDTNEVWGHTIKRIEIAAREGNIGDWRIVKVFDRYDEDGNLLTDSAGFTLSANYLRVYYFYNDVTGYSVVQSDVLKDCDAVPQVSKTMEIIEKNRIVDGNIVEGYDPVDLDVALTLDYTDAFALNGDIITKTITTDSGVYLLHTYYYYKVFLTPVSNGDYKLSLDTVAPLPVPGVTYVCNADGSTAQAIGQFFIDKINAMSNPILGFSLATWGGYFGFTESPAYEYFYIVYKRSAILTDNYFTSSSLIVYDYLEPNIVFKANSWQNFGLVYYDRALRHGSVLTNEDCKLFVPPQLLSNQGGSPFWTKQFKINFQINHTPPDWAAYYKWVYTKNTTYQWYQYFLVYHTDITQVGQYINIDINRLSAGTGDFYNANPLYKMPAYTDWQVGDRVRFVGFIYESDTQKEIRVYDELLDFEIIDAGDAGAGYMIQTQWFDTTKLRLPSVSAYFVAIEVYRPRKVLPDDTNDIVWYESPVAYPIVTPYTATRAHSTIIGELTLCGDTYVSLRFGGYASAGCTHYHTPGWNIESPSYSDYYVSNSVHTGRVCIVDTNQHRRELTTSLRYGGRYIENTYINDLCRFDALNIETLSDKYGKINKIIENGYTLKVLHDLGTTSIYIGRTELTEADMSGANIIAGTTRVLGNIGYSKERWGCQNPESVMLVNGNLYFFDKANRAIVRDANGLFPISSYKIVKDIRDIVEYLPAAHNLRCYPFYNGKHDEIGFSFIYEDPATAIFNDAGTYVFKENPINRWVSKREHFYTNHGIDNGVDTYAWVGNVLVGFLWGEPYTFDTNATYGYFFGTQHDQYIEVMGIEAAAFNKIWNALGLVTNKQWEADIYIMPDYQYPVGMHSRLTKESFVENQGELWAAFKKDMYTNSPTGVPTDSVADLFNGRDLMGKTIKIRLTNDEGERTTLTMVKIKSTVTR